MSNENMNARLLKNAVAAVAANSAVNGQAPPTSSYSTTTQKHQKRYGNYGRHQGIDPEATTMASQLESNNSKYQASKFSTYDEGGVNHPMTPMSQPGMNYAASQ